MADRSPIEWTKATWNPVVGCTQVSPGCAHCYAMEEAARQVRCSKALGRDTHYEGTVETTDGRAVWTGKLALAPDHILFRPLHWKKPRRIFVNSMSDLFHERMPREWIDRVFAVMALCPQHTFQMLTKRPERMLKYKAGAKTPAAIDAAMNDIAPAHWCRRELDDYGGWPLPNVWLGVTAENQKAADERIPILLQSPAAIRWVSIEPMLGPIYLTEFLHDSTCDIIEHGVAGTCTCSQPRETHLDWVVAGGEHGPRPLHPEWARSLRDQCAAAGVPFVFKQWGDWMPISQMPDNYTDQLYHPAPKRDPEAIRRCKVLQAVIHADGSRHYDVTAPGVFAAGSGAMSVFRVGKKAAGRLLDGVLHDTYPEARI